MFKGQGVISKLTAPATPIKIDNWFHQCLNCSKPFHVPPSDVKLGWCKFCSKKCSHEGRKGKPVKWNPNSRLVGPKHGMWKGENAGYIAVHMWIYEHFGKAKVCEQCKTKTAKRYEWANISKTYRRDILDWKQLCKSCHCKFDPMTPEGKERWRAKVKDRKWTDEQKAKLKGRVPWQTGTKGIKKAPKTAFKKGMIPWNKK